jgi:putative serine protease PepD
MDRIQTTSSQSGGTTTYVSNTETVSLSDLYNEVENSVVTIDCITVEYSGIPFGRQVTYETQGSGFVTEYAGQMVIITNNHVINDATSITVTFANGNTHNATILGTDESVDLAVLSTDAPANEYYPLDIVSSSALSVGDSVVAIGSPYGLAGTMTTGIVSSLNRTITITEDMRTYDITGLIQTSAPINSGNSGGPLMTYNGQVVGITTAIVSNSDGLGFAVPSDTILSVMETLLA